MNLKMHSQIFLFGRPCLPSSLSKNTSATPDIIIYVQSRSIKAYKSSSLLLLFLFSFTQIHNQVMHYFWILKLIAIKSTIRGQIENKLILINRPIKAFDYYVLF